MMRHICDRCRADVTGKKSASLRIVSDADTFGNGEVTTTADLCARCRAALERWLYIEPTLAKHHKRKGAAR